MGESRIPKLAAWFQDWLNEQDREETKRFDRLLLEKKNVRTFGFGFNKPEVVIEVFLSYGEDFEAFAMDWIEDESQRKSFIRFYKGCRLAALFKWEE